MNIDKILNNAEKYRLKSEKSLEGLNTKLSKLFDDPYVSIVYQPSDGWVLLDSDANNFKIDTNIIEHILTLSRDEAIEFLESYSL